MSDQTATVFVVDDDISVRESLDALIRLEGWQVETFASAQEFLDRPRIDGPSCLVLDLSLPGLSGLDLQERLANVERDLPIVFITGHGDIPSSVKAMKASAVEFLTKPLREQDVVNAIRQAIVRHRSSRVGQAAHKELRQRYESLTRRERQVMELGGHGDAARRGIPERSSGAHARGVGAMTATASVNGIEVAYDDVGTSEDVLLPIHGHPFNRSMWHPQTEALSRAGWRVIAPDLRGYGKSTVVAGKTTLEAFAQDVAALLEALRVGRVVVAGLSMGGQIAMEFARLHGARLRGIVLAATSPQAETKNGKHSRNATADRLLREGMGGYVEEMLPRMLAPRRRTALPAVVDHVVTMMRRPSYEPVLASLDIPALIVVGDEDAFTTRADADRMHTLMKGSQLLWMEGVGHMPNLE